MKLADAISQDSATVQEFAENIVIQNYEDARTIITLILPLVLRIQINILIFDVEDKVKKTSKEETFPSRTENLNYVLNDSLDFHDDIITVMYRPGHYEILYKGGYYENEIEKYDMIAIDPIPEPEPKPEPEPVLSKI